MIKTTFECVLTHRPRSGQLTIESVAASFAKRGETFRVEPHHVIGHYADGKRYTNLRCDAEGQRVEVYAAEGNVDVDKAAALPVGARVKLTCEIVGDEPHFRFRLLKFAHVG